MEGDFINLNDFEISKLLTVAFQKVDGEISGECLSMTLKCSENHLKVIFFSSSIYIFYPL